MQHFLFLLGEVFASPSPSFCELFLLSCSTDHTPQADKLQRLRGRSKNSFVFYFSSTILSVCIQGKVGENTFQSTTQNPNVT